MLIAPLKFQCCFHCSAYANSPGVEKVIEKFSSEGAWLQARDRMLQPILLRMAEASQGYMPLRWTDARMPLPSPESVQEEPDEVKRKVRSNFWRLCRITRLTFEEYVAEDTRDETLVHIIHRMAYFSLTLLTYSEDDEQPILPRTSPEAMHLSYQIDHIINEDGVLDVIYNLTSHRLMVDKVIGSFFPLAFLCANSLRTVPLRHLRLVWRAGVQPGHRQRAAEPCPPGQPALHGEGALHRDAGRHRRPNRSRARRAADHAPRAGGLAQGHGLLAAHPGRGSAPPGGAIASAARDPALGGRDAGIYARACRRVVVGIKKNKIEFTWVCVI
jgi:hypothetical protein